MSALKNVVVVGASGTIGKPVLDSIINSGKFNVSVLTRESSKASFPPSVKILHADYNSLASLTTALQGQDAVVSTVGNEGLAGQSLLIDASIAAGVKRFIPSEFGSNLASPKTRALPVFGYKVAVQKHLIEKAKANPKFTYTIIQCGPFIDWGLRVGFVFPWKEAQTTIYDGGDNLFSATTLASVGTSVVGVLSRPEETANMELYVENLQISQNRILAIAKKIAPQKDWQVVHKSTADLKKASDESIAKGDFSQHVMVSYITVGIFGGKEYGAAFEKNDNELLGVKEDMSDADIEAILKPLLTGA